LTRGDEHMTDTVMLSASEGSSPIPEETIVQTSSRIAPTAAARVAIEDCAVRGSEDTRTPVVSESAIAPETVAKPQLPPAPTVRAPGQVTLSDCGCGGGANCTCGGSLQKPPLVFAIGKLFYDFGTDARR